ncbi:hypothetical protein CPH39_04695 [Escherichia coli]|nr:hypothetical protein [Escherichia coli]QHD11053.1 hypothetical protein CPH39_04695 [Escherichia coli]HAG9238720.1 hypothetical protein [Escherichia coli]
MSNITFSHALFYQKSLIFTFFTIMLLCSIGNLHNLHVVFYILKKQIDSVRTRNDIGNINSLIRDKHLKRFPLLYSKFI